MRRAILRSALFVVLVGLFVVADPRQAPTRIRPMPDTDPSTWPDEPRGRGANDHGNASDPREDPSARTRSRAATRQPRPDCPNACTRPTGR